MAERKKAGSGTGAAVPELSERARHLLRLLIDRYVEEGEPVGSRTLARQSGMNLSPATIRNVMADLEELGLVRSPHTSAGRVPTIQGYRFFVDSLIEVQPLDEQAVAAMREQLDVDVESADTRQIIEAASSLLSNLTRCAGVVTMPRHLHAPLRHIDFLPLSDNRVLVITVIDEKEVQNRIIRTRRPYGERELQAAANYLNAHFVGKDIQQVREELVREMQRTRDDMDQLMREAIALARKAIAADTEREDLALSGETRLMGFQELSDVEKLRNLFEAFNEKRDILHLLDQCISAEGVQIFIGEESGYEAFGECSVISAPYRVEDRVVGVLGVIGPTRIPYERIIPIVDATSRILGSVLNGSHPSP
ncbi:MAG: heat-inducible transcriptional repressor HrcA [Gammaproteobacteria bacterium]|nr:MAG: heat-inducible transcriptional repressor HrcA [Gammaproteobacteria bacterium]